MAAVGYLFFLFIEKEKFAQGSVAPDFRCARRTGWPRAFAPCAKRLLLCGQESAWREDFVAASGAALEHMLALQRLQGERNPYAHDAFFESVLRFPLFGLEGTVTALGRRRALRINLLWGTEDRTVPHANLVRWRACLAGGAGSVREFSFAGLAHGFFLEDGGSALPVICDMIAAVPDGGGGRI